mmetsp:Transcript_14822/g.31106  ORF Transcript_14822/g.31106 Transcript_14822/m.31106 type:complete len:396 (+) Transcript_14822:159-1346(+)
MYSLQKAQTRLWLATFILLIAIPQSANLTYASDISIDRVFDALDSNHDSYVSREELNAGLERLVGDYAPDGSDAEGGGGAPPLGMDSNPFSYQRKRKANDGATQSDGGSRSDSKTADHNGKFEHPSSTKNFVKALISSFSAIIATEIGDKTFFIAAVLSMRNDRLAVFGGAILALIIMTVLSTMMGLILPNLIPRKYTHIIGGLLFLYFGFKLLYDSRSMEDKVSEELEEVEEELAELSKKQSKIKSKNKRTADDDDVEGQDGPLGTSSDAGDGSAKKRRGGSNQNKTVKHSASSGLSAAGDYNSSSWEAVFVQSLTLTFLAEWGDRSQIATIALAAAKDPAGVTIGGCMGHSICTGMAVVGGRMLASNISEKSVAFYGGLVFLVFGVHSVFFEE